jgi:DNA-binding LytR/AlgR family response regulator
MNKIKVLLVEDEELFAQSLEQILIEMDPGIEVVTTLVSVSSAIKWLKKNTVDLIFLDIQLSDGLSFEIFEKVTIEIPLIFITSYDEYAIKAFKLNSIDYLLKPVNNYELKQAIEKFRKYAVKTSNKIDYRHLADMIMNKNNMYKRRFVVYAGQKMKYIETKEIAFFYILESDVYACDKEGKMYPVEFTLDKLETLLDPEQFFRINRKYIINISAIKNMYPLSKSSIKVELSTKTNEDTVVSLSRTAEFRRWLNK